MAGLEGYVSCTWCYAKSGVIWGGIEGGAGLDERVLGFRYHGKEKTRDAMMHA